MTFVSVICLETFLNRFAKLQKCFYNDTEDTVDRTYYHNHMILFKEIASLRSMLKLQKANGKRIGFIPTMGALHNGHLKLINQSHTAKNTTIASIFINPTQFNDKKDFYKYPVTVEHDILLLAKAKNDILFLPAVNEMYPNGLTTKLLYQLESLETILEGFYRPGHFQGVCRVVHKLLEVVQPDDLYLGQKDYQQCLIVQKLIDTYKLPIQLHIVPTEREESGLAMSSRNLRLSEDAKEKATVIYKMLNFIKQHIESMPFDQLKQRSHSMLMDSGFHKIDYIEICNAKTLATVKEFDQNIQLVALTAAFIEDVRLIDNMLLNQGLLPTL